MMEGTLDPIFLCALATTAIIIQRRLRRREKQRKPRIWTRPWLARKDLGLYETLMREMAAEDRPGYLNFQRMYPEVFTELLHRINGRIKRQDTHLRLAIPPELRLAITLRFLASGDSYLSHQFQFRVAANTIGQIVPDTCAAIYDALQAEFLKCPTTNEEWEEVARGFMNKWQLPNCIGAVDGKHVLLRQPNNTGSTFFNYKHQFSIVLMALVDAKYNFLYVDVGRQGRISDGGVFSATSLYHAINSNNLGIPTAKPLPGDDHPFPYYIVGDDAFPLRNYLMKPYSRRDLSHDERVYNYRISRSRRVVENAFGIISNRFRVLQSPMLLSPDRAEGIVLACCVLHNMLRARCPSSVDHEDPDTRQVKPGTWRGEEGMCSVRAMKGNNATKASKAQRDYLCRYVNSPLGAVEWQERMV